MKVNMTIDTKNISALHFAQIAAKINCLNKCNCDDCVFHTEEVLKHGKLETHCISLYLHSKLNVNKL